MHCIHVSAPPVDGQENAAMVSPLAMTFRAPRSEVAKTSGDTMRVKTVEMKGPSDAPSTRFNERNASPCC